MLDRTEIVDKNFSRRVAEQRLPEVASSLPLEQIGLSRETFLDLFHSQLLSRHLDLQARILKEKGLGYYTIGSSGHEGNAAFGQVFSYDDMAFLHYRSGAFMLQRAKQRYPDACLLDHLLALTAAKDDPCSGGRHKVFGSFELNVPPQTSTIASHLPKAVGCAYSIAHARELPIDTELKDDSVVLCSFGDASVNHSVAQGAFNAASWICRHQHPLPIVFICEDNGYGISVPTPQGWIKQLFSQHHAIHYISANGLDLADVYRASCEAKTLAHRQVPVFLHMSCVRLLGHAGSDIETSYRDRHAIEADEQQDPLLYSARRILEEGWLAAEEIIEQYEAVRERVAEFAMLACGNEKLLTAKDVMAPIVPRGKKMLHARAVSQEERQGYFTKETLSLPRNMAQQINMALTDLMLQFPEVVVFGEDVGTKGGVYHVTADLQKYFGQRRIFDTLLDETTILGTAIGMAHNGFLPIPEIQFLAYLHNAEDQLRGEAATLSFFSQQHFVNPMVVRIASFAYQKGFGGHFHNDNSIAVLRDIPGIIIACPSNGMDAAKMLRTCVMMAIKDGRVVVFLEPIALYMQKNLYETGDNLWLSHYSQPNETIPIGEIGISGNSKKLVIISYANGYYLSLQAQRQLSEQFGYECSVIDLRWIAPLPKEQLLTATKGAENIIIVDECRETGSLSEGLVTLFVEYCQPLPSIKRVTAKDSFIPQGDAAQAVLPSVQDIISAAIQLLQE